MISLLSVYPRNYGPTKLCVTFATIAVQTFKISYWSVRYGAKKLIFVLSCVCHNSKESGVRKNPNRPVWYAKPVRPSRLPRNQAVKTRKTLLWYLVLVVSGMIPGRESTDCMLSLVLRLNTLSMQVSFGFCFPSYK